MKLQRVVPISMLLCVCLLASSCGLGLREDADISPVSDVSPTGDRSSPKSDPSKDTKASAADDVEGSEDHMTGDTDAHDAADTSEGEATPPTDEDTEQIEGFMDHAPGTKQADLSFELAEACVERGETQTIEIKSTGGYAVSWATLWPDQSAHYEWKGFGSGKIPDSGTYQETFTIPRKAPLGRARTDIAVAGDTDEEKYSAFGNIHWRIDKAC